MSRTPETHFAAIAEALGERRTEPTSPLNAAARNAVLGSAVVALRQQPPFTNSQMDGYAVGEVGAREAVVGPTAVSYTHLTLPTKA